MKPPPSTIHHPPCAVVYTRVSSAEQVDGTSLESQRETCARCAERLGLPVLRVFSDEGRSAKTTAGREALAEALALCEKERAALIVYKFDRLARNVGDAYQMRDFLLARGCRIVSATEGEATASPMAKAMYNMMMTFAELDNDMRGERARLGLVARVREGGYVNGPPFGMDASRSPSGVPILVPGQYADLVRSLFLRLADGSLSLAGAVDALRVHGYTRGRAYELFRNPVYAGIIQNRLTGGEPIPAAFPGLVSREVFDRVQLLFKPKGNRKMYSRENSDFPFARVLPCPVCGKPMRGGWSTGRRGVKHGYYFCASTGHCSMGRDDVHAQFRDLARRLAGFREFAQFVRDNLPAIDMSRDPVEAAAVERAKAEKAKQERRLANLRNALLDGVMDADEYSRTKASIDAALAEADGILRTHAEMQERRRSAADALCGTVADAETVFDTLSPAQCKEFVALVFGSVRVVLPEKRIEPPQDSVFQLLATAQAENLKGGEGEGT